ncbi:unnamed protein product [Polarella glacialis]|uniref:Uncharacterized protein n=1 Tax=Polarella glacialis TaxID=89957 RepID=A0A813DN37_POLGL|nr:unnamed protein product [Polarella glacialis]
MSNGTCMKTDCDRAHPEGAALREARERWGQHLLQKRTLAANPDDPHEEQEKRCHAARAAVFAEWIIEVFGPVEKLRAAGGVLEVAGGRGELAFELGVKRGIPCTVLDPRCPGGGQPAACWHDWKLSRPQRLWLKAQGIRSYAAGQAHVAGCPLLQCKALVSEALAGAASGEADAAGPADKAADPHDDQPPQRLAAEMESSLLGSAEGQGVPPPPLPFHDSSRSGTEQRGWREVLGSCGVVVGLHPDQATGGVLELAQALGRPFAVVPCCTFADDFPERCLADGRPVRTYQDLVEWLEGSGSGKGLAQKEFLKFVGKNLVVYQAPA